MNAGARRASVCGGESRKCATPTWNTERHGNELFDFAYALCRTITIILCTRPLSQLVHPSHLSHDKIIRYYIRCRRPCGGPHRWHGPSDADDGKKTDRSLASILIYNWPPPSCMLMLMLMLSCVMFFFTWIDLLWRLDRLWELWSLWKTEQKVLSQSILVLDDEVHGGLRYPLHSWGPSR